MERKRTLKMTWEGLADVADDDDDDRFFETYDRLSAAVPLDLASSDDEDFEDSRMSFASAVSSVHRHHTIKEFQNFAMSAPGSMSPDYNVWMVAPGSITERRNRLFQDMGLSRDKQLLSFKVGAAATATNNINNNNNQHQAPANLPNNNNNNNKVSEETKQENSQSQSPVKRQNCTTQENNSPETQENNSPEPVVLVRSRSDGDIESLCVDKKRKEEMMGSLSKQRLTRTSSMVLLQNAKICSYQESVRVASKESGNVRSVHKSGNFASILSNSRLGAFFLVKNLDTGKEFVVNEYNESGMWNKLSDVQTGKQLTMEEFEKSVGHSPVVKELMRRENVNGIIDGVRKFTANSYLSKSLRMSKRRGAALLKNIKGVANSMSSKGEKERESNPPNPLLGELKEQKEQRQGKNGGNQWVKVRQTGKSYKELSALHLCQEIQAHEGSIWTIKFSSDARFLASAGEDRIIHVWEVQACEVMSMNEGNLTPLHPSLSNLSDKACSLDGSIPNHPEKKKKGKQSSPDYVHVPETVFSLSDKPFCSFQGHLDDVLDLSWSRSQQLLSSSMDKTVRLWDMETKSCLKLFAHNDYVTCIQFNPVDDDYFISGSLDAKVRIWSIPDRRVVDWTDLHEMVTAACYTPDGQNAIIGSHKGSCRLYSIEDGKLHQLNQVDFQTKKKSSAKKITGFQFSPSNPTEVLVTSADSRIRILDTLDIVHKFRGFRNTSSQIAAAFNADGKYIVCASEDSQVYVWKREEHRNATAGKRSIITTRNHEHFQCKDVSVAIPWHGMVNGEPPPMSVQNKRHSKHISSNPTSDTSSPAKEDNPAGQSKRLLPPLPKKTKKVERVESPPEEELAQVSRDPEISESFTSNSSSVRSGDSPSISTASDSSSNSSSIRHDDPASISAATSMDKNSSSFSNWSSWFDVGNHSSHTVQATAWGLVIVTATLGGEIKTYQNFGIPYRLGRL